MIHKETKDLNSKVNLLNDATKSCACFYDFSKNVSRFFHYFKHEKIIKTVEKALSETKAHSLNCCQQKGINVIDH